MAECDKCEEKGYVYEEEKGVVQIRQMASDILISKFMLTEKEIEGASEKIRKEQDVEDFCSYYLFMSEDDINLFKTQSYLKTADEERIVQDFAEKRGFRYVD